MEDNSWHTAGGVGFRYLVARLFRLRMGVDIAVGPDQFAYYFVFGNTGTNNRVSNPRVGNPVEIDFPQLNKSPYTRFENLSVFGGYNGVTGVLSQLLLAGWSARLTAGIQFCLTSTKSQN